MMRRFNVCTLSGRMSEIELPNDLYIWRFKSVIAHRFEMIPEQVKIIFDSSILDDLSFEAIRETKVADIIPEEITSLTIIKRDLDTAECLNRLFRLPVDDLTYRRTYTEVKWNELEDKFLCDREVMKFVLTYSPRHPVSDELLRDKDLMLHTLKRSVLGVYERLPEDLKRDRDILLRASKTDTNSLYNYFDDNDMIDEMIEIIKDDKELLMEGYINTYVLSYASETLRDDFELVLKFVSFNGTALAYASDRLKKDRCIVNAAFNSCLRNPCLRFVSPELYTDREIITKAVSKWGRDLEYAPDHFKDDYEIVMTAVMNDGYSLEYASPRLKADREIVEKAIEENGGAILEAADELKNNKTIILSAIMNGFTDIERLDPDLLSDRDIMATIRRRILDYDYY